MSKPDIGIRRLHRPNGRPRLSDQELIAREKRRNANPIRRIPEDQRIALEAIATGATLDEAAERSSIPAEELAARLYKPDTIRALEAIRIILAGRLRDAALYELACISGAIKNGKTPPSADEKVRAGALKTLVGAVRVPAVHPETLQPYEDEAEVEERAPMTGNVPPQLVIVMGEKDVDEGGLADPEDTHRCTETAVENLS